MGWTPIPEGAPLRKGRLQLGAGQISGPNPKKLYGGGWSVEALHDGPSDELRITVRSLPGTEDARNTRVTLDRSGAVLAVHPLTPDG